MNDFFSMGGYAFYVWSSIGLFIAALLIDFIGLKSNEKKLIRMIKSHIKRNRK